MDLLDDDKIRAAISDPHSALLDSMEVFSEIESTSNYLLEQLCPSPGRFRVALAEHQTAGRGQFERTWHSTPLSGICLSVSYTFTTRPRNFSSLTLAIGASVAGVLEDLGVHGIGLKWPNDIVVTEGKVGGILTEVQPTNTAGVTVVVGIGLNVDLENADNMPAFDHAADIASCCDQLPSRSAISANLITGLLNAITTFEAKGFTPFFDTWQRFDWLRGQHISVELPDELVPGVAQGINVDGTLILETEAGKRRIVSGSVRLGR
jgi:BirA family biotin operon repressor/biotin-[acetyl-CoA-carboxylase] ligase